MGGLERERERERGLLLARLRERGSVYVAGVAAADALDVNRETYEGGVA